MGINWTQIIITGISTGVGACFGTVSTFLVMRYLPKFWDRLETTVKVGLQVGKPEPQKKTVPEAKSD